MTDVTSQTKSDEDLALDQKIQEFRDFIVRTAIDRDYDFDVVLNAVGQSSVGFLMDWIVVTKGHLSREEITTTLNRFSEQLHSFSEDLFNRIDENVALKQEIVSDEVETFGRD